MKKLHLGDGSIMEHNSRFQLLMFQTGMKDSLALMDLYRETLPWGLQSPIIRSEHPPKTLEEWYTKATNFYVGHQRAQHLFKKRDKPANTPSAPPAQKRFSFPEKKDPNTMDIDHMSMEECTRLMKEDKCFRCKLFGHLSRDCPNKGQANTTPTTPKWTGKAAALHIRTLIASMSEEEKKTLEEEGEKYGLGF
jgi:Zinc knuckle